MNLTRSQWPIIIGGVHRSGTSLVRRILNAHSRIYCGPEVKFFKEWYADYVGVEDPVRHARFVESARAMLPEAELQAILGEAFVEVHRRAARRESKPRWADKNPENVLYLREWQSLLGQEWFFVHVVRNPLDTLASIAEANFKYTIPADLEGRIGHYRRYAEAGLQYSQFNAERSYTLVYERLVSSPHAEVERLMQRLGEQAEPRQFDFNSLPHQAGLEDPKVAGTREIHSGSVNRWQGSFNANEIQVILQGTGDLWKKLDPQSSFPLIESQN